MIRYVNPYTPGAGFMPPYLAGRDAIIGEAEASLTALKCRYPQQSVIYYGLRGVGKTVLLNRLEETAENLDILYEHIEVKEKDGFIEQLANSSAKFLRKISKKEVARDLARKAMEAVRTFNFKATMDVQGNISAEISADSEFQLEASLSDKLTDMFVALGNAANKSEDTICYFIDEIQYMKKDELESLINAIHRVNQKRLPIMIFGAGLPKVFKELGDAKSYSERLFHFVEIGALLESEARLAITEPAKLPEDSRVEYEEAAVNRIIAMTRGYPFFIQQYCDIIWKNTENNIITEQEVIASEKAFYDALDAGFFKVRYERSTKREKDFMFAMVKCGSLPCNITNVANIMGKSVGSISPIRAQLINKGLIYATGLAEIDFTVPEFDNYLKRVNSEL